MHTFVGRRQRLGESRNLEAENMVQKRKERQGGGERQENGKGKKKRYCKTYLKAMKKKKKKNGSVQLKIFLRQAGLGIKGGCIATVVLRGWQKKVRSTHKWGTTLVCVTFPQLHREWGCHPPWL